MLRLQVSVLIKLLYDSGGGVSLGMKRRLCNSAMNFLALCDPMQLKPNCWRPQIYLCFHFTRTDKRNLRTIHYNWCRGNLASAYQNHMGYILSMHIRHDAPKDFPCHCQSLICCNVDRQAAVNTAPSRRLLTSSSFMRRPQRPRGCLLNEMQLWPKVGDKLPHRANDQPNNTPCLQLSSHLTAAF